MAFTADKGVVALASLEEVIARHQIVNDAPEIRAAGADAECLPVNRDVADV